MSQEIILQVEGMSCNHCKMTVEKALQAVAGVTAATVSLEKKQAVIQGSANVEDLIKAVEEADFTVVR